MMLKNIVFDVGKVLVEYDPDKHMKALGYDEKTREAVNAAMFQHPSWEECDRGIQTTEQLLNGFVANAAEYKDEIRRAFMTIEGAIHVMPYTIEWLEELKSKGYHLYIISNYGEYTYERTRKEMTYLPYMEGAVFSFQCKMIKPDVEIYQHFCDTYQLNPEECVFLDDREANVEGAKRAGFYAIQFENYEQAREELGELLKNISD